MINLDLYKNVEAGCQRNEGNLIGGNISLTSAPGQKFPVRLMSAARPVYPQLLTT